MRCFGVVGFAVLGVIAFLLMMAAPEIVFAQAVSNAVVVSSCGSASYAAGRPAPVTQDRTGASCTNASGGGGGGAVYQAPNTATPSTTGTVPVIATGGTSQMIVPASTTRKQCIITNGPGTADEGIGATENFYVSETGPALLQGNHGTFVIPPGTSYLSFPGGTTEIDGNANTTGHEVSIVCS